MNKTKIGIFLSLLLLIGLTSCGEKAEREHIEFSGFVTGIFA